MTERRTIDVQPDLSIGLSEARSGIAGLVLHGGGGPATVEPIATHLAQTHRALTPTHPGWMGSARPAWLTRIADLAAAYLNLLRELEPRVPKPELRARSGPRLQAWLTT